MIQGTTDECLWPIGTRQKQTTIPETWYEQNNQTSNISHIAHKFLKHNTTIDRNTKSVITK